MENASKALIIAGSILLSILIIGLGVYIFSQASSSTGDTGLSAMEISSFNGKFESYKGTSVSGTQVSTLLQNLIGNAQTADGSDKKPIVIFKNQAGGLYVFDSNVTNDKPGNGYTFKNQASDKYKIKTGAADQKISSNQTPILSAMKQAVESSHRYYVEVATNDNTGLVHGITINYANSAVSPTAAAIAQKKGAETFIN